MAKDHKLKDLEKNLDKAQKKCSDMIKGNVKKISKKNKEVRTIDHLDIIKIFDTVSFFGKLNF